MLAVLALRKLPGVFGVNLRSGRTRQAFAEPAGVEAFNQTTVMQTAKLSWVHAHRAENGETVYIGRFEDGFMCVIRRSHRT
jgi:hypothetical protein